jgi:hypothetical protein
MCSDVVAGQGTQGMEQTCPQCGVTVPVHSGFVPWCDQCGWNLAPQELGQPQNVFERVYASLGRRQAQAMVQQQLKTKPRRPPFRVSRLLAFVLAALVHAGTLGLVSLGVTLIVATWPNIIVIFLGLLCFGAAWLLRPRFAELPKSVLACGEFPAFYEQGPPGRRVALLHRCVSFLPPCHAAIPGRGRFTVQTAHHLAQPKRSP